MLKNEAYTYKYKYKIIQNKTSKNYIKNVLIIITDKFLLFLEAYYSLMILITSCELLTLHKWIILYGLNGIVSLICSNSVQEIPMNVLICLSKHLNVLFFHIMFIGIG